MSNRHPAAPSPGEVSPGGSSSPESILTNGRLLILAPHMDDETLGCGGIMALHSDPSRIYCLFATDGSRSPTPLLPWAGEIDRELPSKRRKEALAALAELGVGRDNAIFLDLPDGKLSRHSRSLRSSLSQILGAVRPDLVLAPFRLDAHPDHVALNRVARRVLATEATQPRFAEYFVYSRLRLLPGEDIRRCLPPSSLVRIETQAVADTKMRALLKYETQVTVTQTWQERPILTPESLRERCATAEYFMFGEPGDRLLQPFPRQRARIFTAYLAQRFGKRPKDRMLALYRWLSGDGHPR